MASAAFRGQFEHFGHHQPQHAAYPRQQFDLKSLGNALPPNVHPANVQIPNSPQWYPPYSPTGGMQYPPNMYQVQQQPWYGGRNQQMPHGPQGNMMYPQHPMAQMQGNYPGARVQNHGQYQPMNAYWGYDPTSPQSPDMRFAQAPGGHAMGNEFQQFERRPELPPVPSFPRGPPRKPRQSGHALWVGNLPPGATVQDLKDHFSRDATKDIESLFLISKSNCAFVNYRSEEACMAAMNRFHDSRFHGVRLVCRLRRGAVTSASGAPAASSETDVEGSTASESSKAGTDSPTKPESEGDPTIVRSGGIVVSGDDSGQPLIVGSDVRPSVDGETEPTVTETPAQRVPERFFIIKSLTAQDLESSLKNGIWATQSHNETSLNSAFRNAENVYLVFSANKSGEYFGYARMASAIEGAPVNLNANAAPTSPAEAVAPYAIPTQATATAPKGRIIDDSARGTIFWEAEHSDDDGDDAASRNSQEERGSTSGSTWGRQFSIEWISTTRLPFYKARGLRNPWNSNREVKIARDGTEIEPAIGRRLVQMFHQAPNVVPRGFR